MTPDLDHTEAHLTIKNYFTGQPYVDTETGLTTLDLPYESLDWTEHIYEPRVTDLDEAHVRLPSLLHSPHLRPLYQQIKEGDRLEIYNFQPDCGDPVFAGFVPTNGITEGNGAPEILAYDGTVQGKWQHVQKGEEFNAPVSALLDRGRKHWINLVNEDFTALDVADYYTLTNSGGVSGSSIFEAGAWSTGYVSAHTGPVRYALVAPDLGLDVLRGDTFVVDVDFEMDWDFKLPTTVGIDNGPYIYCGVTNSPTDWLAANTYPYFAAQFDFGAYQAASVLAPNLYRQHVTVAAAEASGGNTLQCLPTNSLTPTPPLFSGTHRFTFTFRIDQDTGFLSMNAFLDNLQIAFATDDVAWNDSTRTGFHPFLGAQWAFYQDELTAGQTIKFHKWRVRQLVPYLNKAPQYNPQTQEPIDYIANNEDLKSFFDLFVEKDNSEYRLRYHPAPQLDDIELDAITLVGKNASAELGYGQAGSQGTLSPSSPELLPDAATTDSGLYATTPPFRFEEGWNMIDVPKTESKQTVHANEVIRVGGGTQESQIFVDVFDVSEQGNPIQGVSPSYPVFEVLSNDDRVGLLGLARDLADLELEQRLDPTPSLAVTIVDELPYAFRYRIGDYVFTKTISRINNLEELMRIAKAKYTAGSIRKEYTLGKREFDPSLLRLLAKDTTMQWLWDQSGSSPLTFVYPYLGSVAGGATSTAFPINIDQFTSGTQIVAAYVHWFATTGADQFDVVINKNAISPPAATATDSGLVDITSAFGSPNKYTLAFTNNDGSAHVLEIAYLIIRIKV